MLDLTRSILVWREPVTARSRTICSCTKTVSSLTLAVSSWVVFRSSSNLVTLPAKSIRALLPLRLSWVTPAPRIGQAIDASMLRTTSTFPAVDIGSLLPRSQREEGRRNRTCQAQDNARKNLSTARRLFLGTARDEWISERPSSSYPIIPSFPESCQPKPESSYRFTETTHQDRASPECRWVPILGEIGRLLRGKSRR